MRNEQWAQSSSPNGSGDRDVAAVRPNAAPDGIAWIGPLVFLVNNTDTFKTMGPFIVTDLDPTRQRVAVRINGRVASEYDTATMIFDVAHYVAAHEPLSDVLSG